MAAPINGRAVESDSSSDEDDENYDKLKDALASDMFSMDSKNIKEPRSRKDEAKKKPSLRHQEVLSPAGPLDLKTTPEFRDFVAKKLSAIVESTIEIDTSQKTSASSPYTTASTDGVRLFKSSSSYVCADPSSGSTSVVQTTRRRRLPSSSGSDTDELARCAAAAVSGEQILAGSQITSGDQKEDREPTLEAQKESRTSDSCDKNMSYNDKDFIQKYKKKKKKKTKTHLEGEIIESDNSKHDDTRKSENSKKHKKHKKIQDTSSEMVT